MMKINTFLHNILYALAFVAVVASCDDDDEIKDPAVDFAGLASTYSETDGTVTIPVRINGSVNASDLNFEFTGTAVRDSDFEFIGFTNEGVQIRIIDDNEIEAAEKVAVRFSSTKLNLTGNNVHELTIISDCADTAYPSTSYFAGSWMATEKYGVSPDDWYGPYAMTLIQDKSDPNKFYFDNFYDSGCESYLMFDFATGTVRFPDQAPCDEPLTNSSGTFEFKDCKAILTVTQNFDGGDWMYSFEKPLNSF